LKQGTAQNQSKGISANLEGLKRKFWDILQGFKNTLPVYF
jgi:hypothetical protein